MHWRSREQSEKETADFISQLPANTVYNTPQLPHSRNHWMPARILPEVPQLIRALDLDSEKMLFQWQQPEYKVFEEVMNTYYPFHKSELIPKGKIHKWSTDSIPGIDRSTFPLAFENMEKLGSPWLGQNTRDSTHAYSGLYSQLVSPGAYSAGFKISCKLLRGQTGNATICFAAKVFGVIDDGAQCVIEIKRNGQPAHWFGKPVRTTFLYADNKGWWHGLFKMELPEQIAPDDELVAYVWNNSSQKIWVDDCSLVQVKQSK
jgi:hypothetical protein